MKNFPKISVYTTFKNNPIYLSETIESIFSQTFQNFEIILVDGSSDCQSGATFSQYTKDGRFKYYRVTDNNAVAGFFNALARCSGEYVMCLPISDVYLSRDWFAQCVDILENDGAVSMVHGNYRQIDANGNLGAFPYAHWQSSPPPDREDFFAYWLATYYFPSEITYCVRRNVYMQIYPPYQGETLCYDKLSYPLTDAQFSLHGPHLQAMFNLLATGFLTCYLPQVASASRIHADRLTDQYATYMSLEARKYTEMVLDLRRNILNGKIRHRFRDRYGNVISELTAESMGGFAEKVNQYRKSTPIAFNRYDEVNTYFKKFREEMKTRWRQIKEKINGKGHAIIYGAGQFTENLFSALGEFAFTIPIKCIVDRNPIMSQIAGIPVMKTTEYVFNKADHCIVSSKAFAAEIVNELAGRVDRQRIHIL